MRQRCRFFLLFTGVIFWLVAFGYGQDSPSLGDAARQARQQKQAKTTQGKDAPAPKVVTNDEIPEHPAEPSSGNQRHESSSPDATPSGKISAEQWKAQIQAQKNVVSNLQKEIDRLNSSIHFVQANLYVNGARYNQHQAEKQQEVERAQAQLDEQKKRLEDMQESARKQGYGSSVYDP